MRLLNTTTLHLSEFPGCYVPSYAILSHTWGEEEISFQDVQSPYSDAVRDKAGYEKLRNCCKLAKEQGFEFVWIDTCCINKDSSAELSEAINSMYRYYQDAEVCYAYLPDVTTDTRILGLFIHPSEIANGLLGAGLSRNYWHLRPSSFSMQIGKKLEQSRVCRMSSRR